MAEVDIFEVVLLAAVFIIGVAGFLIAALKND